MVSGWRQERERGVCICVSMCACSGEVDCESSLVTHKASAIKEAHFIALSYGKNTEMDAHVKCCTPWVSLLIVPFLFIPSPLSQNIIHIYAHAHTYTAMQGMSTVLTPPYVGLGVVADAKTRGTSQYQQSTACLLPLTHHHVTVLIINHTKT